MSNHHQTTFGAFPSASGVRFSVWAPDAKELQLVLFASGGKSESGRHQLAKDDKGVFHLETKEASVGSLYKYVIDGKGPFPDPASRFQPDGIHGASLVVDHSTFKWTDQAWKGISKLEKITLYELHVGTFTSEGTYKGVKSKLEYLKNELGVTMIELLPLADSPGRWNWGYDGVALYAPGRYYGTPDELKDLVNSAHAIGLGVLIDLVYNHLGPDGNYLSCFNSHYFTAKHNTPWGSALNYDRSISVKHEDGDQPTKDVSAKDSKTDAEHAPLVRAFVVDNGISWMRDYHFDGARLDATHAIVDYSSPHVLQELVAKCKAAVPNRPLYFFAEDDRNETELVTREHGLDSLWADDFHHQVRVNLAGDNESYFQNFTGSTTDLAETIQNGWFFKGQKVPTSEKGETRGTDPKAISNLAAFCCCIQNHDQIGNRPLGERLNHQISLSAYKVASAILLLIPEIPMLFQGQEFACSTPFQYFTDHNAELGKLVTEGRRREFGNFKAFTNPETREKIPDPQAESTFQSSKVKWDEMHSGDHGAVLKLYQALLKLRTVEPAMQIAERSATNTQAFDDATLTIVRKAGNSSIVAVFNMKDKTNSVDISKLVSHKVEVILTTDDAPFKTSDTKQAPTLNKHQIQFASIGAVVLRSTN